MKFALRKSAIAISLLLPCLAHAISVSEYVFTQNGGDINNVRGTIAAANESLRQKSYDPAFNAVGHIYGCTATWLGDDAKWVYVLSAAHCVGSKTAEAPTTMDFYADDNKTLIASGGTVYTTPLKFDTQDYYPEAATDLIVFKLNKVADYRDKKGKKVVKPVLYDGNAELDTPVEFVGYGTWGVGMKPNGSYGPVSGQRRLWSTSTLEDLGCDYCLAAGYEPVTDGPQWSRVESGDSGSAWWQAYQGIKTIVGVTYNQTGYFSAGPRISKNISWIQSIYPDVDILSEHAFNWSNNGHKGTIGNLYVYDNPFTHETEYFMLTGVGSDGRYGYFPTDKSNNNYWFYLGTNKKDALQRIDNVKGYKNWSHNKHIGKAGDIYVYYNPYNHDTELFRLKKTGEYWYFPTNKKSNADWEYVMTIKY